VRDFQNVVLAGKVLAKYLNDPDGKPYTYGALVLRAGEDPDTRVRASFSVNTQYKGKEAFDYQQMKRLDRGNVVILRDGFFSSYLEKKSGNIKYTLEFRPNNLAILSRELMINRTTVRGIVEACAETDLGYKILLRASYRVVGTSGKKNTTEVKERPVRILASQEALGENGPDLPGKRVLVIGRVSTDGETGPVLIASEIVSETYGG